jgi:hypothetical protein
MYHLPLRNSSGRPVDMENWESTLSNAVVSVAFTLSKDSICKLEAHIADVVVVCKVPTPMIGFTWFPCFRPNFRAFIPGETPSYVLERLTDAQEAPVTSKRVKRTR